MKLRIVSQYPAKFWGSRPCGCSDTAAKIVYMTLQDHMIKGSGDFMEGNSSLYTPSLPKLIAIDILLIDLTRLYVIIWSYDCMDRSH